MDTKTHSEVRKITPAEAKDFLTNNNFHLQRTVKQGNVTSLAEAMRSKQFPSGTAIFFAQTPTALELIDGQHRFIAQIEADIDVEYTVVTLACENEKAAGVLYTQFDIGAKRTITDRMKALNLGEHIALPSKQANLLAAGSIYLKYKFGKILPSQVTMFTPLQRLAVCKEYEEGAIKFFECMDFAERWVSNAFLRPHFVALGAYLFHHSPELAQRLWSTLAKMDCGGESDPRWHLFHLAQKVETKAVALRRSIVVSQAFIHGWNAFVDGKPMTKLTPAPVPAETIDIFGGPDVSLAEGINVETKEQVAAAVMEQLAIRFPKKQTA